MLCIQVCFSYLFESFSLKLIALCFVLQISPVPEQLVLAEDFVDFTLKWKNNNTRSKSVFFSCLWYTSILQVYLNRNVCVSLVKVYQKLLDKFIFPLALSRRLKKDEISSQIHLVWIHWWTFLTSTFYI